MPHEIYVDWAAAYPDDAKHFVPLYTRPAPLSDERIAKVLRAAADRARFVTLKAGTPSVYMVDIVRMVERELFEGE